MKKSMMSVIYEQLYRVFRKRRFALFNKLLAPTSDDVLLDVGGSPWFWISYPPVVKQIDSVNIYDMGWDESKAPEHHIRSMIGDGCALTMPAASYDIAFSNSVIEHVGSWENQQRFAAEIRRVGKSVWVQTPAQESILEPHFMTLFVHHLPSAWQKKMMRYCSVWGLLTKPSQALIDEWVDGALLLKKPQMRELFPDCEILTERMVGIFPKSYIAYRRDPGTTDAKAATAA